MKKVQNEKGATRRACNMKKVQQECKECTIKRVQHEKNATRGKCIFGKTKHDKSTARKKCNMKIVQHKQSMETEKNLGKSAKEECTIVHKLITRPYALV